MKNNIMEIGSYESVCKYNIDDVLQVCSYVDANKYKIPAVVIICAPTRMICGIQVGGMDCEQRRIEGFPIFLRDSNFKMDATPFQPEGSFEKDVIEPFNDCSWGCWGHTGFSEEHTLDYAKAIDKFLEENFNEPLLEGKCRLQPGLFFSFDYARKEDLMEGCWPVLVQFNPNDKTKFKGYLYLGNCD